MTPTRRVRPPWEVMLKLRAHDRRRSPSKEWKEVCPPDVTGVGMQQGKGVWGESGGRHVRVGEQVRVRALREEQWELLRSTKPTQCDRSGPPLSTVPLAVEWRIG